MSKEKNLSNLTTEMTEFKREIGEITEFYVTEDNEAKYNTILVECEWGDMLEKIKTLNKGVIKNAKIKNRK